MKTAVVGLALVGLMPGPATWAEKGLNTKGKAERPIGEPSEAMDELGPPSLPKEEVWKRFLKKQATLLPCCGGCAMVSMEDAKTLWPTLGGEQDPSTLTSALQEKRKAMVAEFTKKYPERWASLKKHARKKEGGHESRDK